MRERIKAEKANSHFDISYEMLYNYFIGQEIKRTVGRIDFQTILRTTLEHCPKDFVYSKSNKYHVFFAGLMDSRDARSIISALPEKADDEAKFEDVLKKFMRLRDALYDSSGNRFPPNVFNKNLSAYPVLKEHIGKRPNITAKTVEGFVRSAANDNALFAIFNGTEQKTVVKHQLELVDGLTEGYIREGFALGEGVSAEKMQKILRDILYVKNFIRNKLNHASEDDSVNEEKQKYFSSHGYNTSNELSCDEITEFMKKAIEIKER